MKVPQKFSKVFLGSAIFANAIYVLFGLINVLTFGNDVHQIVLENLSFVEWQNTVAKIGYAFSVLLTYPIMVFPVYSIFEKSLKLDLESHDNIHQILIYALRNGCLLILFVFACFIPQFGDFLSLVGGAAGMMI